jgi:lysozyme
MSNNFADLSSNNAHFNVGAYASSGPVAVMLKATEDSNYHNPFYSEEHGGHGNWVRDCHRHNLAVFHYHFARPEHGNPRGQMDWFWEVVKPHFRRPGDYLVIDLETGDPREGAAWVREADAHLRSISDSHPWCYTYLSYFMSGEVTIASKNIHMAAYGSRRPGNFRWRLPFGQNLVAWQFTDGVAGPLPHSMAGIGECDVNVLNPSLSRELHKVRPAK